MENNYAMKRYDKDKMARAIGRDLAMSTKTGVEICRYIRNKNLQTAKKYLEEAAALKRPVPFKKFRGGAGHKRGMASGKYPVKASTIVLNLLKNAETNAQSKGLNTDFLKIIHTLANKASRPMKYGRIRGEMKRSHVEIVVEEIDAPKKDPKKKAGKPKIETKAPEKVDKPKVEAKPVEKPKAEPAEKPKVEAKPKAEEKPKVETKAEEKPKEPEKVVKPAEKPKVEAKPVEKPKAEPVEKPKVEQTKKPVAEDKQ